MSQNRPNNPPQGQQQGLQRQQPGGAVSRMVSGTLTRLSDNEETRQLTTWNPEEAVSWIEEASQKGHVVTPSMMPVFPHGRGMAVSIIRVTDFDKQGTQLYPITGSSNLGLHKNVLDEIGRGYGIDWPKEWTFREPFTLPGQEEDPRDKDPFCIKITVAGRYKKFDGTWSTLPPLTKEIDLRDGSAEVTQILQQQEIKALRDLPNNATEQAIANAKAFGVRKAYGEINQLRKFIRLHAQTKARLAVIGTLVRRSYSAAELQKPFYVFSSVWTGRSDDPEINKMLAQGALDMEKEGRAMLYGGVSAAPKELLPAVSDKPYNEDAEMVEYQKAVAEAEGNGEQTPNTESTNAPEGQPKQCGPTECFGEGARHLTKVRPDGKIINFCTGDVTEATQSTAASESKAWTIDVGAKAGMKVDDPQVTVEDLNELLSHYKFMAKGGNLPTEAVSKLMADRDAVQAEVERRKTQQQV